MNAAETTSRPSRRSWLLPTAVILLAPIALVVALRLPLVNQLEYADAWFYSGYAWVPTHHFGVYDWTYFSVRFPAILPIALFDRAFGVHGGYVLLRYLLAAGTGLALYVGVRRFARQGIALATVVLLYLNPLFTRMLLWDYAGYMVIAAGVSGIALWYWADDRRLPWSVVPGALLALAVLSNLLVIVPLAVLFVVELTAAARTSRIRWFSLRCMVSLGATAGVYLAGFLAYKAMIGDVSPEDLIRPVIDFIGNNEENSGLYQADVGDWILSLPRVIAPIAVSVALIVAMGRSILGTDVRARLAQGCVALTAGLWVYRFGVTSSVIETWWAFDIIVLFLAPATGVLLAVLDDTDDALQRRGLVIAVGAAVLCAVVIRGAGHLAENAYDAVVGTDLAVLAMLIVGLALAVAVARSGRWRLAAIAALLAMLQLVTYAPDAQDGRGGTGVFARDGDREWRAYAAGKRVAQIISSKDSATHNVAIWYPGDTGLVRLAWVDLLQFGQTLNIPGEPERVDRLTPFASERLKLPQNAYVLVLSPRRADMTRSLAAIGTQYPASTVTDAGTLADGDLHYQLIDLHKQPVPGQAPAAPTS